MCFQFYVRISLSICCGPYVTFYGIKETLNCKFNLFDNISNKIDIVNLAYSVEICSGLNLIAESGLGMRAV